jgi:hypothetical protein
MEIDSGTKTKTKQKTKSPSDVNCSRAEQSYGFETTLSERSFVEAFIC